MKKKTCIRCGGRKGFDSFYAHPKMADGRVNVCKECTKARTRYRYQQDMEDPDYVEKERRRNRARMLGKKMRSDPRKRRARTAVSNAVRDGRLTPKANCEQCGHDFSFYQREAHHEDYRRPLVVVWLCAKCHGGEHQK